MSKLAFCPTCGGAVWVRGSELIPTTIDARESIEALARLRAEQAGLDPALVCALIEIESGWNPWAVRYEPGYRWLYPHELVTLDPAVPAEKKLIQEIMDERGWPGTPETETTLQRFSLGPMQAMGATMRERGYNGWLPQLCDPEVNLEWGLKHLLWLKGRIVNCPICDGRGTDWTPQCAICTECESTGKIYMCRSSADLAAAWNAGSVRKTIETGGYEHYVNQDYVDRFLAAMERYKEGGR